MQYDNIKILLLEDSQSDAHLILRKLTQAMPVKIEVCHVLTLADAVKQIKSQSFDVAIIDLSLPDSKGIETVKRIHKIASEMPIVVLTGQDDASRGQQAVQYGAQDYLSKDNTDANALSRSILFSLERNCRRKLELQAFEMEQRLDAMQEAINHVAHELRTPLAAMRASAELLLDATMIDTRSEDSLKSIIHKEVIRLSGMVDNLLESARLNSGVTQYAWSLIDIPATIDHVVELSSTLINEEHVRISISVQPEDMVMRGDEGLLTRLLLNLLTNALKHTQHGTIEINVLTCSLGDSEGVEIHVCDTGVGMPTDVMRRLGQSYALNSPTASDGLPQGIGLGLNVCRAIAAAHGGVISVSSTLGKGSRFTATLRTDLVSPCPVDKNFPEIQVLANDIDTYTHLYQTGV